MTKGWKRNTRTVEKQCLICNKQFKSHISSNRIFCSKTCFYQSGVLYRKTYFPITEETRLKMHNSQLGTKKPWSVSPTKGKNLSEQHKLRIGIANKGKIQPRGENHWNWKGGYENKLWHNNKRRVMKNNANGSHSQLEWELLKKEYNYTCPSCLRIEPEIKLGRDHIIPLSKEGSDYINNIQPLCPNCNSKKKDKIIKFKELKFQATLETN
jgi:hypothetical protein